MKQSAFACQTCAGTQQDGEVVDHSQAVDLFGEVVDHPQAADQFAVLDPLDMIMAKLEPTPLRVGFTKRDWKLKEPLQRKPTSDHIPDKENDPEGYEKYLESLLE